MKNQNNNLWRQIANLAGKVFGHPNSRCRVTIIDKNLNRSTNEAVYTVKFLFRNVEDFKKNKVVLEANKKPKEEDVFKLIKELIAIQEIREFEKKIKDTAPETFEWHNS